MSTAALRLVAATRPSRRAVVAGWLAFVVAPAALFWIGFDAALVHEEARIRERETTGLVQEYEAFRRELETPVLLERVLGRALRAEWLGEPETDGAADGEHSHDGQPNRPRASWPWTGGGMAGNGSIGDPPGAQVLALMGSAAGRLEVWRRVRRRAGVPLVAMIWHGPDTRECYPVQHRAWSHPLPRWGLQRWLAAVNGQAGRRPVATDRSLATGSAVGSGAGSPIGRFPARAASAAPRAMADDPSVRRFLALAMGDVVRVQVRPNRCSIALTARFGGGRWYLYHALFTAGLAPDAPVLGGCLVVVRERDLTPAVLLRLVAARPASAGLRRSWRLLPQAVAADWAERPGRLPRIIADRRGVTLIGRPGQWFLRLVAARGGFAPEPGAERLVLAVTATAVRLAHPLRPLRPVIGWASTGLVGIGSVLFLGLRWFGFGEGARLGTKILLGVALAAGFPALMLGTGFMIFERVQDDQQRELVGSRLEAAQQIIDRLLRQYLIDLGHRLLSLAPSLEPLVAEPAFLESAACSHLAAFPVQDGFVCGDDDRIRHLRLRQTAGPPEPAAVTRAFHDAVRAMARGIRLVHNPSVPMRLSTLLGIPIAETNIGDFLGWPGQVMPFQTAHREQFLATVPLVGSRRVDGSRPTAVLAIRLSEQALVDDFVVRHHGLLAGLQETVGEWRLRCAVLSSEQVDPSGELATLWEPASGSWRTLRRCTDARSEPGEVVRMTDEDRSGRRIVAVTRLSRLPALIMAWGESSPLAGSRSLWAGAMGYAALLLTVVIGLMRRWFETPVLELARVADAVADGQYPAAIEVRGTDEIGRLGATFAELVQGLRQRDELARFVSDEVLAAVSDDTERGLAPGGELLGVSVLFAGIVGLEARAEAAAADVVRRLDMLLVGGEAILRRHRGSLDKMIEATLMGVFRGAVAGEPHELRAARAALDLARQLPPLLGGVTGGAPVAIDVGIASGTVLSGRIGSHRGTLDFSVIGNAVNLASRFKGQAHRGQVTRIMIAPATLRALRGRARVRFVDRVAIKGRTRTFPLYELLELRPETALSPSRRFPMPSA